MNKKFFVGIVALALAVSVGASANAAYMHSTTLKMGSKNAQVMELQKTLNMTSCKVASSGVGSAGMESMYFGAMTKAAVICFQSANGLAADGVVGAMSGAKLAGVTGAVVTTPSTPSTPSTPAVSGLTGGAGSVKSYKLTSDLSNEEVGEDENDVKVAGLEVEADDSSDLQLTAVKVAFAKGTATSKFEKFADEVSVWFGSTKVATLDADEFDSTNSYTKTISLAAGAIVRSGEKGVLTVAVSGINNLDSGDVTKTWTVDFQTVRFVDAQGAVVSDTVTTDARTFSFESFASATDAELKISLNSDDDAINDAHIIQVDDTNATDDVSLLSFKFEAKGDSDLWIDEVPVLLTVDATASAVSNVVSSLDLYAGSTKIGSETVTGMGTTQSILFDDLDWTLDAGKVQQLYVKATIIKLDGSADAGDTVKAEITTVERNAIVVEDEAGDDLGTGDRSGTALGNASAIYKDGVSVSFISASESVTSGSGSTDDIGTFSIKFKVTAFGDNTVYIPNAASATSTEAAVYFDLDKSGVVTTSATGISATLTNDSDSDLSANTNFDIESGASENFTLTVSVTNSASGLTAGQYRAMIKNIRWSTTDSASALASAFNGYTFNLDDYKTDYKALN